MTRKFVSILALLAVAGCTTLPQGPSVRVLPGDGKPFEEFVKDDAVCRQWAGRGIGMTPEETAKQATISGAAIGTLIGAGAGAAFGAAAGNAGAGAAIGGGTGLLFGTASGSDAARVYGDEAQLRYDNTYVQCMYAKGNLVPGGRASYYTSPAQESPVPPDYTPAR